MLGLASMCTDSYIENQNGKISSMWRSNLEIAIVKNESLKGRRK